MKRMMTILLAVCTGAVFASAQQQDNTPRVDKRETRQQARINHGVKSGQLTPKEANRLEKQQSKIKANEAKAKSDGKITPKEHAKLTKEQNRASRNIHRKKHNAKSVDTK